MGFDAIWPSTADGSHPGDREPVGYRMRNENGSGLGHDSAYDNIKVPDVTP